MADTFSNDLRLRLQESGANSGQWGSLLNDTLTNIASAFSLGSEAIPNASTHTITLADDSSSQDEARSLYLKCTGGGQACTVTLAPNTVSKVWIISNETSFTLTFSAGSGANVAVASGAVKVIVTDGAGSGAAVVDALSGLEASLSGLTVDTTTLVVDSTNNRVGAGVASPQSNMHVLGTLKVATGNAQGILGLGEGAGTTVNVGLWRGAANNPTSDGNFLNLGGYDGIVFAASNAAIGSQTEAMRILSNQRVSIGGSSSNHLLNVTSSTTPALEFTRGSGNATIGIDNGNSIAVGGTAGDLVLRASGTTGVTRFTDSGGNITMTLTEANNVVIGSVGGGTATATPVELNLGSTFANSVGSLSKAKFKLFEDSSANVYGLSVSSGLFEFGVPTGAGHAFFIGESEKMRLNQSGNLGLGLVPNTWSVGRALELGFEGNALWGNAADEVIVVQNAYYNSGWKYATTRPATHYSQYNGGHRWFTAPSGTADAALSWTQAMALDSDGAVTKPNQPSFQARLNANQTGFNSSGSFGLHVGFNVTDFNVGSHFSTTTGLFTAPVAGLYFFEAATYVSSNATQSWFVKNGARAAATDKMVRVIGTDARFLDNTAIMKLAANDTVGFHPFVIGNTSLTIISNINHTYFKGYLIG